jgi:hypothetical protein
MTESPGATRIASLVPIDERLDRANRLTDWLPGVTPLNVSEERERFLSAAARGLVYEPVFRYRAWDPAEAAAAVKALVDLDFSAVPAALRPEYEETRDDLAMRLELIRAFAADDNNAAVNEVSKRMFWPDDPEQLVAPARRALGSDTDAIQMVRETSPAVSSDAVATAVRKALADLAISWETVVDASSAARVRVSNETRQVFVGRDARFRESDIRKILVHEIDTHVVRAENGRRLWQFALFAVGTPRSEMVEEGMALINEQSESVARPHQLRVIALHVVGIAAAAALSFSETFRTVLPYFHGDEREAFDRVLRWKRGLRRQDRPGALWKDTVYFGGLERVQRYLAAGGTMAALYLGRYDDRRMPHEVTDLLQEFGRRPRPAPILPRFVRA